MAEAIRGAILLFSKIEEGQSRALGGALWRGQQGCDSG